MKTTELQTEQQVLKVKEEFAQRLKKKLQLYEVFAPLFVKTSTGLNDDLNGVERPISFKLKHSDEDYSIVHSLAKWKRHRLTQLEVPQDYGIITEMNAIRADEDLSHIHSAFVDQWDWELRISKEDRTLDKLKSVVQKVYEAIYETQQKINDEFGFSYTKLPQKIHFVHTEDLQTKYPQLSPKERETAICKELKAVFLIGIGADLPDGKPHDGRAPDYDDWSTQTTAGHRGLNGDILVWCDALGHALELSSMGIRVDAAALATQCEKRAVPHKLTLPFQKSILNEELVYSLGGGIGRSRIAMFMLQKKTISEVQFLSY